MSRTGTTKIMGLIERDNMVLIPVSITPHGHAGPLFIKFFYGHGKEPHDPVFRDRPNGQISEESVRFANVYSPQDLGQSKPYVKDQSASRVLWRLSQGHGSTYSLWSIPQLDNIGIYK